MDGKMTLKGYLRLTVLIAAVICTSVALASIAGLAPNAHQRNCEIAECSVALNEDSTFPANDDVVRLICSGYPGMNIDPGSVTLKWERVISKVERETSVPVGVRAVVDGQVRFFRTMVTLRKTKDIGRISITEKRLRIPLPPERTLMGLVPTLVYDIRTQTVRDPRTI